jgi:cephalosporin hydroxylase
MIKLKIRIKRTLLNLAEQASFCLSRKRPALYRMFERCSSHDDLFHFADEQIGIGQNKDEFLRFLSYLAAKNPKTICEIGVREGGTNFMFANAITSCRRIIGIDILLQHVHLLKRFSRKGVSQVFISGDSSDIRIVRKVEQCLRPVLQLDILFIDGDHSYEGVVKDFYAYRHLVREGGVMAFHDICMDHRRRFGAVTSNDSGEIYLFWKKIKANYEYDEFYTSEDQNGAGIGAIIWDPNVPVGNYREK